MDSFKYVFLGSKLLEYDSLRKAIENNTFEKEYPKFTYIQQQNSYMIKYNESSIYIYKKPIKVSFQIGNEKHSIILNSDVDLQTYCSICNLDINNLFFEDGTAFKDNCKFISEDEDEIKLNYKVKEKLTFPESSFLFKKSDIYYPVSKYSNYYQDYFGYNIDSNTLFEYKHTETRKIIFKNINSLFNDNRIKFKFTGPFNIGKSITLLQYSRLNDNVFYINLKVLSNKEERDCYMILLEEFSRAKYFNDYIYKNIIEPSYEKGKNPIESLLEIMKYLSDKSCIYIFIFDQYKTNSFTPAQEDLIKSMNKNIKIVYCSSINNKNIKDECIKTWKHFSKNIIYLSKDANAQEYYFYFSDIYPQTCKMNESIIEQISKINRFKKYFEENDTEEQKISKVNNHINEKMKEFANQIDNSLDFVLIYIKSIINKKYPVKKIDSVLAYCPLKYLVVEFINDETFVIKMQFPFLHPIINRRLLSEEVDDYFKNEKYLKLTIEDETIKGNYFEEAAKIGLKKHIILPKEIDSTIEVEEIATMREINKNSLDYSYLEEESSQDDSSDEMSDENKDLKEDIIDTEEAKIKKIKIDKRKNIKIDKQEIDTFLKKFNTINCNINPFSSEDIEHYREKEISKLYNGDYYIKKLGKSYDGKNTYFLEQKKRTGKTLDCALLYGEEKKKTFIGFQIKCYFSETTNIPQKAKDKISIKSSIKEILINSMYLLNCKITSWNYYLIFYINKKRKNCNVDKSLIDELKNNIEVIYYDPVDKKFYDINKNIITNLKLTPIANLDNIRISFSEISINPIVLYQQKAQIIEEEKIEENFKKDFEYLNQKNVDNIIKKILSIMEVKEGIYELKYQIGKLPRIILSPSINYIFLYKRNNNEGFIGIKCMKDENNEPAHYCYDLKNEKEINFIEIDCLYFYTLQRIRPEKIYKSPSKKRVTKRPKVKPELKFSFQNNELK